MTPPKPKLDLMKFWPLGLAAVAFTIAYAEMRTQIGYNNQLLQESKTATSRLLVMDSILIRHLNEPAHGSAGQRITAAEREVAVLRAQMKEILRRLSNLDRKLAEPNGSGK